MKTGTNDRDHTLISEANTALALQRGAGKRAGVGHFFLLIGSLLCASVCLASTGTRNSVDLNHDGKADLFWYNLKTGDTSAWLMNGVQLPQSARYATFLTSSGWTLQGYGDFDGDGKTDLFWYNPRTGDTSAWLMNGNQTPRYVIYANVPFSSGWTIQGFGDFDGDGKTDVFWYNRKTGDTSAWLMTGAQLPQYAVYQNVARGSGWTVQGFGDFNGDGRTDVFWYNAKTGGTSAWLMNGGQTPQYGISYANVPASTGWTLQGFGDFNGDGKTDLFWYNPETGEKAGWLMDGNKILKSVSYSTASWTNGWVLQGFGDFDGDGKTDLFWFNRNTGETASWIMNGDKYNLAVYSTVPVSDGWALEAFGDFDGDGKTDLFWYNHHTGETSSWLMNGSSVRQNVTYNSVAISSGWIVGGPNMLRMHVIPLSDGEIGSFGRANTVTTSQFRTLVDASNVAYAPAGLQFEFDETADWEPMKDTALNSMTNDDSTWWKYPNQIAARYPGEIVVFLRWGKDPKTPAINAFSMPPDTGFPIPPDAPLPTFSVHFIAFYNSAANVDAPTFVHELGHYLGLYHTFPGWSDNLTNTLSSAAAKISAGGGTADALNGDLLSDTPAEAGTAFYLDFFNTTNACAPYTSYTISGITFKPDRQNVMGYFGGKGCQPPYHVSSQQILQVRTTLRRPGRRGLLQLP